MTTSVDELLSMALPKRQLIADPEEMPEGGPAWLDDVESALDTLEVIAHTQVSQAVRAECEMEMAFGKARGWRIGNK